MNGTLPKTFPWSHLGSQRVLRKESGGWDIVDMNGIIFFLKESQEKDAHIVWEEKSYPDSMILPQKDRIWSKNGTILKTKSIQKQFQKVAIPKYGG